MCNSVFPNYQLVTSPLMPNLIQVCINPFLPINRYLQTCKEDDVMMVEQSVGCET